MDAGSVYGTRLRRRSSLTLGRKPYVGAAYADEGIWHRMCAYAETLHGNNVGLKALVAARASQQVPCSDPGTRMGTTTPVAHDVYLKYATEFEDICRNAGGAGVGRKPPRSGCSDHLDRDVSVTVLALHGQQRALYDAMRDVTALHGDVRLVRMSVYDDLGGVPLANVLSGTAPLDADASVC